MNDNAFPIKGRYIVAAWLMAFIYLPGVGLLYSLLDNSAEWYWYDITYYYYHHAIFLLLLAVLFFYHKVNWRLMLSRPVKSDYIPAIKLTTFSFLFSIAAAYALFYPLSYVWPGFVTNWFIDIPPVIYSNQGQFPFIPNALSFISLVVLAPLIEEFSFRGVLLHRWQQKWGINKAILLSSLLFGLAHPDPIGATFFGIAMSILYLKTGTLMVPILCHALNNFVAWLFEVGYIVALGPEYEYTLEDFQSEWFIGLTCGVIAAAWSYAYLRGEKSRRAWRLPDI